MSEACAIASVRSARQGVGWTGQLLRAARRGIERMELRSERRRQRRALLELDDRMLRDIGISRADAYLEARKSVRWR